MAFQWMRWCIAGMVLVAMTGIASAGKSRRMTVKAVVGQAEAISPDSTIVKQLRIGMRVLYGWNIRTEEEAEVDLLFENGAILHIGEKSIITLSDKLEETDESIDKAVKRKDTL